MNIYFLKACDNIHYTYNNPVSNMDGDLNIMISGPLDLTQEVFDKVYVPKIEEYMNMFSCKVNFLVGGATGADQCAREYFAMQVLNGRLKTNQVTVHEKKGNKNHIVEKYKDENGNPIEFLHNDSYRGYLERDEALVKLCDRIIAYMYQYGSVGSGTNANLISFYIQKLSMTVIEAVGKIRSLHMIDSYVPGFGVQAVMQQLANSSGASASVVSTTDASVVSTTVSTTDASTTSVTADSE